MTTEDAVAQYVAARVDRDAKRAALSDAMQASADAQVAQTAANAALVAAQAALDEARVEMLAALDDPASS